MFQGRVLSSARARFVATAATVFALVALGGVAATPAYADGTIQLTVTDASTGGAPYAGPNIYVGATVVFLTGGMQSFPLSAGSYIVMPTDTNYFNANTSVVVTDDVTTPFAIEIDKYHATGTIPGDVGVDTTVTVEVQNGGPFDPIAGTEQTIVSGASTFDVRVPYGPNTYRLKFAPASGSSYITTYSAPFVIAGTSLSQAIGYTAFGAAGTITGSVLSAADSSAVTGATVYAEEDGSVIASATVALDGSYSLSVGASSDIDVLVRASAGGFVDQWYNGAAVSGFGTVVSLTAANSHSASAINFSMVADLAEVTGNLTQYGGGNEPSPADIFLYKFDTGTNAYLATPYGTEPGSADFSFSDLPDGSYRLAFRDTETDQILTWQIRDRYGSPAYAYSPDGYGLCSLDFGVSGAADIQLPDIEVVGQAYLGYCSGAPYGSPSDKTVTGTVVNTESLSPTVFAKLYQVGSGGGFSLVDISAVNSTTGDYSLGGVRTSGNYFVQFSPDATSSYLPTLLGADGDTAWAQDDATVDDFAADHSFAVDVTDDSTLNVDDVTLIQGALITGTMLTEMGDAIHGQVSFRKVGDSTDTLTVIGNGDGWGSWRAVLPVGDTYTMHAVALEGTFASEYWQDETRLVDANPVGPLTAGEFGEYEFRLASSPPVISGEVSDLSDPDPITVHLFFKDELDLWRAVDEQTSVGGEFSFDLNYDTGENDGLLEGDYRLRFEDSNGVWLAATEYTTGLLPSTWNAPVAGPACFVDVSVESGPETAVNASFDITNQSQACAAEPAVEGDVTGRFLWNGTDPVDNREILLYSHATHEEHWTTTSPSGFFTFSDVVNGDYSLSLYPPEDHVDGDHEYSFYDEFTITAGAALGVLVPLRYGNVSGTISDWDNDSMAGATASVFAPCGCGGSWDYAEPYMTVEIDEFGHFEAPGVSVAGPYSVLVEPADHEFVPQFLRGGFVEPDDPFTGVAETDFDYGLIALNPVDFVSISGTVMFGDVPAGYGIVVAVPSDGSPYGFDADVQADGTYELLVAPNVHYQVFADAYGLIPQIYDGVNFDFSTDPTGLGTPVEVGVNPVGDIDFSLIAPEGILFDLYVAESTGASGGSTALTDVETHLYKYVVDGWEEVDTELSDGYVMLEADGDADYRLRFSRNGEWLSIDQTDWDISVPPYESGGDYDLIDACFIDFDDLLDGSVVDGRMFLDSDPTLQSCGDETLAEHYVVRGTLDKTGNMLGGPVDTAQTVQLRNASNVLIGETTSDPTDGSYGFSGVSPGTYSITVLQAPFSDTEHVYVEKTVTGVVVDDNEWVPIELTRYGDAVLDIDNWDASMAGATAQLWVSTDGGTTFAAVGEVDTVDSGEFVISGIAVDGIYEVWIDYPTGFVDGFARDPSFPTDIQDYAAAAEEDFSLATVALTTVSGTVSIGAAAVNAAEVTFEPSAGTYEVTAITGPSGGYSAEVPAGTTFTVYAQKSGLVRDVITTQVVGFAPQVNVNLEMHFATFFIETFVGVDPLTVHLYKKVTGGWQQVVSDTDTVVYLWANLSGDYRLRFSDGADWLAVSEYEIDGAAPVLPVPNACFIDFAPAIGGAEYEILIEPVVPTGGVECAAEPAVVAPPVTPGTSGSGRPRAATTEAATTTTEEEVEPTSTPTPSPEPSETETDAPDDATDADAPATTSAPDFTWAFWVAGILALFVLAGGAVYFMRRRP